jgi:hypothetical protein
MKNGKCVKGISPNRYVSLTRLKEDGGRTWLGKVLIAETRLKFYEVLPVRLNFDKLNMSDSPCTPVGMTNSHEASGGMVSVV